jgi:outer membrane lipoprotein-sorting protein
MRPAVFSAFLAALLALGGCAQTPTESETIAQRQDKALQDPMNYSPSMDNTDITGGDVGSYDAKAMQRDLNDFWNP